MQQIWRELLVFKTYISFASTHTTSVCNLIHEVNIHSLMCIPIHELHYKFSRPLYAHPFTRLSHVPFIHTMSLIRSRKQRTAFHLLPVHDPFRRCGNCLSFIIPFTRLKLIPLLSCIRGYKKDGALTIFNFF